MPQEAFEVHGLGDDFLGDKPVFANVAQAFVDFIGDAKLVIHNAAFDMKFLNAELSWVKRAPIPFDRAVDTLMIARRKFPGSPASLDALCRRFGIDNSSRTLHGALLDSEILAEVYLELIGGKQPDFALNVSQDKSADWRRCRGVAARAAPYSVTARLSESEKAAHAAFVEKLGMPPYGSGCKRLGVRCFCLLCAGATGQFSAIKLKEINSFQVQWRESTVTCDVADDPAHKREKHPRAFDQQERMQLVIRYVSTWNTPAYSSSRTKRRVAAFFGLGCDLKLEDHFVLIVGCTFLGIQIDLKLNVRLHFTLNALLGKDVFERHVAHELRKDVHFDRRLLRGGAIASGFGVSAMCLSLGSSICKSWTLLSSRRRQPQCFVQPEP